MERNSLKERNELGVARSTYHDHEWHVINLVESKHEVDRENYPTLHTKYRSQSEDEYTTTIDDMTEVLQSHAKEIIDMQCTNRCDNFLLMVIIS